jgi:hypothetical protein
MVWPLLSNAEGMSPEDSLTHSFFTREIRMGLDLPMGSCTFFLLA